MLAAMDRGESAEAAARRFEVHPTTARKWPRLAAAGQTAPRKVGAKRIPTKLTPQDMTLLEREVTRRPGVTLRELMGMVSVRVAESTICRALVRLGYRYKKRVWLRGSV